MAAGNERDAQQADDWRTGNLRTSFEAPLRSPAPTHPIYPGAGSMFEVAASEERQ